jgi:hypothetical protein
MKNHRNIRSIPAATLAVVVLFAGCGDATESTLPAVGTAVAGNFTSDRHYNETARFQSLAPSNVPRYGTATRNLVEAHLEHQEGLKVVAVKKANAAACGDRLEASYGVVGPALRPV